jgi:UDP-N-acetylglucosamine:LPS N-acetylglucosamine transferase
VARGHDQASIEFVGSRRGQEADLLAGTGFPLTLLAGRGIARRLDPRSLVANAVAVAGLLWATLTETARLARHRPRVVVSVGGYAAVPGGVAAAVLRVPVVGVFGGSLGARSINRAASGLARRWAGRADRSLYHVTGRRDWDAMGGADAGTAGGLCLRLVPFEPRMDLLYQAADVVVCRAGAITVAELAVAGVPAVLVPLPGAPGDHQTANARALVAAGAGVLLPDADCDPDRLEAVLDGLLADPGRLAAMGAAARAAAHPDAADRVAEVVDAHAR